jgi:hypothetical protein
MRNGWGGNPDILDGVDTLVGRKIANPVRLRIDGWTYGGFMASRAVTRGDHFRITRKSTSGLLLVEKRLDEARIIPSRPTPNVEASAVSIKGIFQCIT